MIAIRNATGDADKDRMHGIAHDAKTVQVFGELGYAIKTPYADLEPFAAASYVHLKSGGIRENGTISNLTGLAERAI